MFKAGTLSVQLVPTPIVTMPVEDGTVFIQVANGETIAIGGEDVTYATGVLIVGTTSVITAEIDVKKNDVLYGIADSAAKTIRVMARTGGVTEPIIGVVP